MLVACQSRDKEIPQRANREKGPIRQLLDNREERIRWHRDARFGGMVHFTPDTIGKVVHYDAEHQPDPYRGRPIVAEEFDRYYTRMTLQNFDAEAWVSAFADAGMKYFVFVAKHHNGFCMWDSKYTNYDIYAVTGRDVVAELAEACKKHGITFGLYYSIMDWYHPHATGITHGGRGYDLPPDIAPNIKNYISYMNAQLRELTTKYGRIGLLWYDGAWMSEGIDDPNLQWTEKHARDLYEYSLQLQEGIITNNRMQRSHYKPTDKGDYYTPENFIGNFDRDNHWESIMKLGVSWHWVPKEPIKQVEQIQAMLSRAVGNDGNLLLNIGPHPDGFIEPNQVEVLKQLGKWLDTNGEAVYGTRGGPYLPSKEVVSTNKGSNVYLHLLDEGLRVLTVDSLDAKIESCTNMKGEPLSCEVMNDKLRITLEENRPGVDVIRIAIDKNALDVPLVKSGVEMRHSVDTEKKIVMENVKEE
ncbi:MAG: alpha-L-fucosidase [Proteobacteria bacterium]|nr:alpha-L-fucosidase [Pseudomonadota bacterium]